MNSNYVPIEKIKVARLSGECEPKPFILNEYDIPIQLTREQLEDTLVALLEGIRELKKEIDEALRG